MRYLILFAITSAAAWACSCGAYPSAKEAWLDSPVVFAGSVEKTDDRTKLGHQTAWVRVKEPFKGVKEDQLLELNGQISSCYGGLREGTVFLFYLYPGEKQDTWVIRACHRTRLMSRAADDLKFLRGLPDSARGNRVSGEVVLREEDFVKELPSSRALAGVRVRALSNEPASSYETFTDAQGLYEFRNLRPGDYTIKVDYPKGTILSYSVAYGKTGPGRPRLLNADNPQVKVTAESGNGFSFDLAPDTRIAGRVLDPNGRPMKGVCLDLDPLVGNSARRSRISDCSEPDGSFVLDKMPAGSYRLVANRGGKMRANEPFGQLYYPGTPDLAKAGVLTIAAGEHIDGIDFHVPELARRIELRGRLTFSDGVALPGQSIRFRGASGSYQEYRQTDADGNFTMQILAGQSGTLTAQIMISRDLVSACPQFNTKLNPKGLGGFLTSTPQPVAGDMSLSNIELVFPFPSCEAWLKREAELNRE